MNNDDERDYAEEADNRRAFIEAAAGANRAELERPEGDAMWWFVVDAGPGPQLGGTTPEVHPRYPEMPPLENTNPMLQVGEIVAWLKNLWNTYPDFDRQFVLEQVESRLTAMVEGNL